MHVEQTDNVMTVKIAPKEILQMLESRRLGVLDVELLCPLIYQIGLAKKQKKSYAVIVNQNSNTGSAVLRRIMKDYSANMCLQLIEHAGVSKKGLSAFRSAIRQETNAIIVDGVVYDAENHVSLDWLEEIYHCSGLVGRAARAGDEFLILRGIGETMSSWSQADAALRIGILVLVSQNCPDYVIEMHYDMSKNDMI